MRSPIKHTPALTPPLSTALLATAGVYVGMFALGYAENLKGPTLNALMDDLGLRYGQGGTILLGAYLGYMLSTPGSGLLVDRFGARQVALLAGACLFAGSLLYSAVSAYLLLILAMFIIGLGLGALNVSGNSLIITHHANQKGRYLNQMGFFHSLASTLAPFIAGQMLAAGLHWRTVYHYSLLPIAALLVYFLAVRLPAPQRTPAAAAPARDKVRFSIRLAQLFDRRIAGYYLMAIFYCATELGAAAWMVTFLQNVKGQSVASSAAYLAVFFACIMTGRLLGSLVVERTGYLKAILAAGLGTLVCLALGAYGPAPLVILLPFSGLFLSIVFPTTTAALSNASAAQDLSKSGTVVLDTAGEAGGAGTVTGAATCKEEKSDNNRVLGLFFASAGLGGILGSWSIGAASDFIGLHLGFGILLITTLLLIGLTLRLITQK